MRIVRQSRVLCWSAGIVALVAVSCEDEVSSVCHSERKSKGSVCLERVTGRVIDEKGRPVPDLSVTVCGPSCFRGFTDARGEFVIVVGKFVLADDYSVQPHGTPTKTTFYYPLPTDLRGGNYDAGTLRVLPSATNGALIVTTTDLESGQVPPAQILTSGPVTLELAAGTSVRLSINDVLEGDEGRRFRASELTPEFIGEFTKKLEGSRVIALGPFETEVSWKHGASNPVNLSVENSLAWPAQTEVSVLALGTYLDATWITPSQFKEIGVARVSRDGEQIVLSFDEKTPGLRYLTWLALTPQGVAKSRLPGPGE